MDAKTLAENLTRVQEHLRHEVAQTARLRAALRELVAAEPVVEDAYEDGRWLSCFFCSRGRPWGGMAPLEHEPDCSWVKAKALLHAP